MHICVIGAGVVGLTTAYFLQSERHEVTVVDRAPGPGLGASGGNGASSRTRSWRRWPTRRSRRSCPGLLLSRHAPLKIHPRLDRTQLRWGMQFLKHANTKAARDTTEALLKLSALSREFIEPLIEGERIECDFSRGGKLVVYPDAASLEAARAQVTYQAALGARGQQVLTAAQCVEREPAIAGYADRIGGGVWTRNEAAADCGAFCTQVAELLARRGARLLYGRTVTRIDSRERPRARADDRRAEPLRADAYVLAAGDGAAELGEQRRPR